MKKIFLVFFLFLTPLFGFADAFVLKSGDWRVQVSKRDGRFLLFNKKRLVNTKDNPLTSYSSLRLGQKVLHLGKQIPLIRVEKGKNTLTAIYQYSSSLLIEQELSFREHPYVYDEKGLFVRYRIRFDFNLKQKLSFRFLFDNKEKEGEKQGYILPSNLKQEILTEKQSQADSAIFYPFFFKSFTKPSKLYFSSWRRASEYFLAKYKPRLDYRDVKSGNWDPAFAFYYDFKDLKGDNQKTIDIFIGLWKKENRGLPRVKVFHPLQMNFKKDGFELPLQIQNVGDPKIRFIKLILSSPELKERKILQVQDLKKGESRFIFFKNLNFRKEADIFSAKVEVFLFNKKQFYKQSFHLGFALQKEQKKIQEKTEKGSEKKLEKKPEQKLPQKRPVIKPEINPTKKKEASLIKSKVLNSRLEKLRIILYFLNLGLKNGISAEILQEMRREIDELEKTSTKKN